MNHIKLAINRFDVDAEKIYIDVEMRANKVQNETKKIISNLDALETASSAALQSLDKYSKVNPKTTSLVKVLNEIKSSGENIKKVFDKLYTSGYRTDSFAAKYERLSAQFELEKNKISDTSGTSNKKKQLLSEISLYDSYNNKMLSYIKQEANARDSAAKRDLNNARKNYEEKLKNQIKITNEISKNAQKVSKSVTKESFIESFLDLGDKEATTNFKSTIDSILSSFTTDEKSSIWDKIFNITKAQDANNAINLIMKAKEEINNLNNEVDEYSVKANKANDTTNKIKNSFSSFINELKTKAVTWRILSGTFKQIVNIIGNTINESSRYTESLNLYTVALGEFADKGLEWAERISEPLYLDTTDIMQYTGGLYNLVQGLGVASDASYTMATNLTQLAYDMSSYLNIDVESAFTKLQSAITGQSRAVATSGVALQVASVQELAYSMGIEKNVSDMTQAEKTYLRYIQIMRSTSNMQGDLARTIVTPANAMRVVKQQITLLTRAIGNVLIPILMKAIPYITAFTQMLTDLANKLASFVGIKLDWSSAKIDYSGITSLDTYLSDVEDQAGNTGSSLKKAAEIGLAAFDELNVLQKPDSSSGGGSIGGVGGVGGSVLPELQEAVTGYDMLEGLTKQFDKNVENAKQNINKLKNVLLGLLAVYATFKTITWFSKLNDMAAAFQNTWTAGTGLMGVLKKIVTKIKGLSTATGEATGGIKLFGGTFKTLLSTVGKAATVVGGAIAIFAGHKGLSESFKQARYDILKYGEDIEGSSLKIAKSTAEITIGATAIGAVFGGPVGAAIGAVTGGIISLGTAFSASKKAIREYADELTYGALNVSQEEWAAMLEKSGGSIKSYKSELDKLNDSLDTHYNKFQENFDQLALYGIEFGRIGNKISSQDAVNIMSSIENIATEATKMVEEGTSYDLMVISDTFDKVSGLSDDEKSKILTMVYETGEEQKKTIKEAQDNITKIWNNAMETRGYLTDSEYKYIKEQLAKIRELTRNEMSRNQTDMELYKKQFMDSSLKLDKQSYDNYKKARDDYYSEQQQAALDNYNIMLNEAERYRKTDGSNYGKYIALKTAAETGYKEDMKKINDTVKQYNMEIAKDLYRQYLGLEGKTDEVSKEIRSNIEGILKDLNIDTSELEKQFEDGAGTVSETFNSTVFKKLNLNPTIKLGADTTGAACVFNDFGRQLKNNYKIEYTPMIGGKTTVQDEFKGTKFVIKKDGGYVDSGDFFFANENGVPEYITSIGNKSAVVNQDQMVSALTNAIVQGLSNMNQNSQSVPLTINVGNDKLYSGMIKYVQKQNNIYGSSVVNI